MGLAERFKNKLDTNDIFSKKNKIEESLNDKDIRFISKPVTIQQKQIYTGDSSTITNILESNNQKTPKLTSFEDLETEIISKIRKTPYWEEYSIQRQENMISSYFDKKIKTKYSDLNYSSQDKLEFIQNILALANNR